MATGCVKDFLKNNFLKNNSKKIWLPSILAVTADLIDIHSSQHDKINCFVDSIKYNRDGRKIERQFCICKLYHLKIFDLPQNLPDELQINNKSSAKESYNMTIEIEGFTIIQHYYDHGTQYLYPENNYVGVLSTIFFFCPYILWTAIENQLNKRNSDRNMLKAVHNCLRLYIILENIETKVAGETYDNLEYILREINNSKVIPQIESAIINMTTDNEDIKDEGEKIDHVAHIIQIGNEGIDIVREKLMNTSLKKRRLKRTLGLKKYKKIFHNKNTSS